MHIKRFIQTAGSRLKGLKPVTKMKVALGITVLCIAVFMLIVFINMREAAAESRNVESALSTLNELEKLFLKIQTIETGQRGFTLNGDESFLSGYTDALKKTETEINEIKQVAENDKVTRKEISALASMVTDKIKFTKLVVETRRIQGYDSAAAVIQNGQGKVLMDRIINAIDTLQDKNRLLLLQSNNGREIYARRLTIIFFILSFLFLASIFTGYFFLKKDIENAQVVNNRLQYNAILLKNISDPIVTTNNAGYITNWNVHAEQLYGLAEGDITGRHINEILPPAIENDTQNPILHGVQGIESWKGEVQHRHKDGSLVVAEMHTSILQDKEGKNTGTVSVIRDITQRKKLEKQLMDFSQNLQQQVKVKAAELNQVFERITDAFIALDKEWRYTHVNNIAAAMHRKTEADLIGKKIWDVFPDIVGEPFYHALQHAALSGNAERLELYFSKEDKWYEDLIYPGKDGISVYYHDITVRKKAEEKLIKSEEALKSSNERFQFVAKATNDALWDWDMLSNKLWGNESFSTHFGIPTNYKLQMDGFLNRIHPGDQERIIKNLKKTLSAKGNVLTEEFRFIDKEGNEKVMYDRAYIIYNEQGRAYRMLGAMQDITASKTAEKKLLLEKELSDSIINSLPGIFYVFNKKGQYYRWNKNLVTVTGYTADEIKKMHPLSLFSAEEKELVSKKINSVFNGTEDTVEADCLTKDGRLIPYYFTGMVINYEGESCLMGVGIDISEKVQSQKELKQSEEKFRRVVEQASDGIFITNDQGQYLDVNASGEALTGYSKEELLKMNVADLFRKADMKKQPLRFKEMLNGLQVLTLRDLEKKNGTQINVEISGKKLDDGRLQAIIRDVTARTKAEEALKASEYKYRVLFDENPLPMWIIDTAAKIFLDVNSAAITSYGYSRETFLNMDPAALHPKIDPVIQKEELLSVPGNLESLKNDTHVKMNGTQIKVNIISHDIVYENKKAVLTLANDVTEKLEAEQKLQQSHKALRDLASHLETIRETERTHMAREIHDELGQQLTGLKMDISWLNKHIKSDNEAIQQKMIDTIELIDKTVVTVRRIATELRPSILDDLGLVAAMEWQSDEFEKRSEIKTTFKSNVNNITVKNDIATAIFRIFQESLTNVLRHSLATKVKIFLIVDNETITLNIKDNGVGFLSEDIAGKKTLGLLGMKERALLIYGTYEINGNTGSGTSVIITVPLNK